jgi:hypothetical protein
MDVEPDHLPWCPRCRYDLRGMTAMWTDSCPLSGTCPECGLEYLWRDVVQPDFARPQWCVEFSTSRSVLRAALITFARSWAPWHFWKRIQAHHRVRPGRLILYVALMTVAPLVAMYVAGQVSLAIAGRYLFEHIVRTQAQQAPGIVQTHRRLLDEFLAYEKWEDVPEKWHARFGYPPFRNERPTADEWRVLWQAQIDEIRQWISHYENVIENPPVIHMSYTRAVAEVVFTPWRSQSSGYVQQGGQRLPYASPRWQLDSWWTQFRGTQADVPWVRFLAPPVLSLILLCLMPLTLILVWIKRLPGDVRRLLIARIAMYSIFIPFSVAGFCVVLASASFFGATHPANVERWVLLALVAPALAAILWWYMALKHHLHMQHALAACGMHLRNRPVHGCCRSDPMDSFMIHATIVRQFFT